MKTFNFFGLFKTPSFTELRESFYSGRNVKVKIIGTILIPYSSDKLEKKLFKAVKTQILTKEVIESEVKFLQEHIDWKKANCRNRRMSQAGAGMYWHPVSVAEDLIKILESK